ncbi:MAG: GAF domain-containing protein [Desulfatitalea sp.]
MHSHCLPPTGQSMQDDLRHILAGIASLIESMDVDSPHALATVLGFTLDCLEGRFVVYHRFDLEQGQIVTQHGCKLPEDFRESGRLSGQIGYEELLAAGRSQAVYPDLSRTAYATSDPDVARYHLRAYAGASVRLQGRTIGSLAVYDDRPRGFDEIQCAVLNIASHWVASITAKLSTEQQLARKSANEKVLSAVSAKAISTHDSSFIDFCLQTIGHSIGLDIACLQWYEPEHRQFNPHFFHWTPQGIARKTDTTPFTLLSVPIIRDVLENRQPFYCVDCRLISDPATQAFLQRNNVSSFLLMPICNQEKLYGLFIMAMQTGPRGWQEEGLETLMAIMGIIAQWKEGRSISQQLDESQALNNQMFQLSPAAIYRIDLRALRLIKVNDQVCRYTGYTEEELIATPPDELMMPESRQVFYRQLADIEAGNPVPDNLEFEFKTKSGATEWGHLHIRHLYDEEGKIWGANVVANLITEQKKARDELAEYRRSLEVLVEERTRALSQANQMLREEVSRRTETAKELHMNSERLRELNTAMRVLLDKRNEDRLRSEENIRVNLVQLIEPYLDRLDHSGLNSSQQQLLNVIRMNLNEVIGSPMPELSAKYYIFSPGELQVANLIRKGRTTKDMSRLLNISPRTVESYRNNIRKKLGLKNKKVNLKTYLSSKE